jgi:tRNA(fMet)-specific endonuclease VapC
VISFLLGANIAVCALDGACPALRDRMEAYEPGEVALSATSLAEVAYGSWTGKPPAPEVLDAFVASIPLVPFDEAVAREYARLPFRRARFDRLLAAHALSSGATVVTNTESDFADVPGLMVETLTV